MTHGQKHTKQFRGPKIGDKPNTNTMPLADLSWGGEGPPSMLSIPRGNLSRQDKIIYNGTWTYPKKNKIQFKC